MNERERIGFFKKNNKNIDILSLKFFFKNTVHFLVLKSINQ